jgi:hypothetical protein
MMCDRRDKGTNDECNIFMMGCDDGYDESIMCNGVRWSVMQVLCVTSMMYDGCNVIMTKCEDGCDETIMRYRV